MNWIKADYRFNEGRAIFFVTTKHMVMERMVFSILEQNQEPELLESAVRELLTKYRPELSEASIYYLGFNAEYGRWEFGVAHPSLPRTGLFEKAQARPLDPAYERDMLATAALGGES